MSPCGFCLASPPFHPPLGESPFHVNVSVGLGRVGFCDHNPARFKQRSKIAVERPERSSAFPKRGRQQISPARDSGSAHLVRPQGPEELAGLVPLVRHRGCALTGAKEVSRRVQTQGGNNVLHLGAARLLGIEGAVDGDLLRACRGLVESPPRPFLHPQERHQVQGALHHHPRRRPGRGQRHRRPPLGGLRLPPIPPALPRGDRVRALWDRLQPNVT